MISSASLQNSDKVSTKDFEFPKSSINKNNQKNENDNSEFLALLGLGMNSQEADVAKLIQQIQQEGDQPKAQGKLVSVDEGKAAPLQDQVIDEKIKELLKQNEIAIKEKFSSNSLNSLKNFNAENVKVQNKLEAPFMKQDSLVEVMASKTGKGHMGDIVNALPKEVQSMYLKNINAADVKTIRASNPKLAKIENSMEGLNKGRMIMNEDGLQNLQQNLILPSGDREFNVEQSSIKENFGQNLNTNAVKDLSDQISARVQNLNMPKAMPTYLGKEVSFDFHHHELGTINVNIRKTKNDIEVKIATGQNDVRSILMENRELLTAHLAQRGVNVSSITVDVMNTMNIADEGSGKSQMNTKNESFNQQQNMGQDHSKHSSESQTGKEKRDELWSILKEQREEAYA